MSSTNSFAVIVAAAGNSSRFADRNNSPQNKKQFVMLADKPVWQHSVEKFIVRSDVKQIIITPSPEDIEWFRQEYAEEIKRFSLTLVEGGKERDDSVLNGLNVVLPEIEYVAVHDAARPCVSPDEIEDVFTAAKNTGAAILAAPLTGTIKRVSESVITETVPRTGLYEAQTPQVFRRTALKIAFTERGTFHATDEAQLLERIGIPVTVVNSSKWNLKITSATDLLLAEKILAEKF
ncbi:MAG: 2-C-methyl-D-erythritol 4-phosphate cytidylyltransferase [Planctomycetaceae bacterium]|nr:2-C-methyl-D-erythritol 4-phosphate cytidylyltransferase [Planctomycetaceae bacterium]